ncbi:MAG TPA: DJ-1/PfpI family protein [Candidatus Corynebacterium avicola]|uniref:DJ-1/PfpI family protein n=1 Tax=Candidatus Corynebacterium avicola TaxID=2838527 RepID=A0A9D1RMR0_9CORY|nr:DJ-1/PfpI family protein [Candidatus Corynebacterium avicola]
MVFLLAPGVHLLDVSGPAQVFSTANDLVPHSWPLTYVAETPDVHSAQGLMLRAETDWPTLGSDDVLVVPGWQGGDNKPTGRFSHAFLDRVVEHHDRGGTIVSICSGAFALAEAGLLAGRRATTHHHLQDRLATQFADVKVARDVLYVSDDRIHSSAGIASGIDLALHIVAEHHGPATASVVARDMVVYARRNGQDDQVSALLRHRSHIDELVHRTQDVIDSRFNQPLPLPTLADAVSVSPRTLTRSFTRVLGMTPLQYQQLLRLERAEILIAAGTSVEASAREVGFEDARMLRTLRSRSNH